MSENATTNPHQRASLRRLRTIGVIAVLVAVGLAFAGIAARAHHDSALKLKVDDDAVPTVSVIDPGHGDAQQELVLPSNVQAFYDAPIYARVPGYLKKWYVDIGAKVKAGDLLAEIETPELDQQLRQAQADLATAVAKARLAETTTKRWQNMLASTSVSKQEADEKSGDFDAKKAAVGAERANVDRLQALQSFKRIVAPFDGTVTARKTDIGALINAGSGSGGAELFRVADTHKLRVYVQVPQTYASLIQTGMQAQLRLPEQPGRNFPATVVNTADAISESSRTLLVQLEADNAQGKLISGSYADVHFDLPTVPGVLQLPVTALVFRRHGLEVATVGADNKVVLKSIQLGRDYGTKVEVVAGLDAKDRVIDSPPDWLAQGDKVRAFESASAPAKVADKPAVTEAAVAASAAVAK
jgi:RND family efflux transporter MFP subunit